MIKWEGGAKMIAAPFQLLIFFYRIGGRESTQLGEK